MSVPKPNLVIIGAGIAGLAAALRLSGMGFRVTVLEAAHQAGGKARAVPTAAGPADTGPTVMTMRPVFEALFAAIGTRLEDHVTLTREPILARHFWPDGAALDLFDDAESSTQAIDAFAGARAGAEFRRFAARARRLFEAFEKPMMHNPDPSLLELAGVVARRPALLGDMGGMKSLKSLLDSSFSDPRLRALFGRYATYVGGAPNQSPALLALIFHSEARGIWRVSGGIHHLARVMADLAAARGVEFRYTTKATRIEKQQGRVRAVITEHGTRLPADFVIFNGDPRALALGLLGEAAAQTVSAKTTAGRALSAAVWAFAAKPVGRDLAHHNVFFGADPATEFDPIRKGQAPSDPTIYICAQDRGTGMAPPHGLERFEIILNAPAGYRGPDPEEMTWRPLTFQTLSNRGLRFQGDIPDQALTLPHHFAQIFPASDGSLYGQSPHGMTAALTRPRVRTNLMGLYLAGGGVHPGAGIPMACLSGQHAAEAIMTDLALTSPSRPMVMHGGISTA